MSEVGRQQRQPGVHVAAVAIPVQQGGDGEGVSQVVRAGPASFRTGGQPGSLGQAVELQVDVVIDQPGAGGAIAARAPVMDASLFEIENGDLPTHVAGLAHQDADGGRRKRFR